MYLDELDEFDVITSREISSRVLPRIDDSQGSGGTRRGEMPRGEKERSGGKIPFLDRAVRLISVAIIPSFRPFVRSLRYKLTSLVGDILG